MKCSVCKTKRKLKDYPECYDCRWNMIDERNYDINNKCIQCQKPVRIGTKTCVGKCSLIVNGGLERIEQKQKEYIEHGWELINDYKWRT